MVTQAMNVAATGMQASETLTHVISNNMSNFGTTAFKRDAVSFESLVYQSQRRLGTNTDEVVLPSGIQIGLGVKVSSVYSIFEQGELKQTFGQLDMAIQGKGYFKVIMPDGSEAYTRAGDFKANQAGVVVTNSGYTLGDNIIIPSNAKKVQITEQGVATAILPGNPEQEVGLGNIKLYTFINENGLKKLASNLYAETTASGVAIQGDPGGTEGVGTLLQGWTENSNANPIRDIIDLIGAQRSYELCSKVIQAGDEMLQIINNSRR